MYWLITGGAGFIGTNLCERLLGEGHRVQVVDDLSRLGSERNAEHLAATWGLKVQKMDISDQAEWWKAEDDIGQPDVIAHLAGQVSFLESLRDPYRDFQVNAIGTLNVLEYTRLKSPETVVIGGHPVCGTRLP